MLFCLDEKHMIPKFEWGKTYYIDGCLKRHNRELYKQNGNFKILEIPWKSWGNWSRRKWQRRWGEKNGSHYIRSSSYISLISIPVVVKNEQSSLVVNALQDGHSTQTYLNDDVAADLGLEGKIQKR